MRRTIAVALLWAAWGAAATAQQGTRGSLRLEVKVENSLDVRDYHALVIGINDYSHLTKLETAVHDARKVGELLQQEYGFHVYLQLNPTRADILREMSRLRAELPSSSSLLIYYAGHGYLDEATEIGYWLPVDAEEDNPGQWISNQDITSQLKAIEARHVMIVADSCYSGTLTRDAGIELQQGLDRDEWLQRMASRKSRTVMTSGSAEPVVDGGGGGHSVFARAFLDALGENQAILDGKGLFDRIKRPVVLNADQTPRYADIRKADHQGGDFLFVPRRKMGLGGGDAGSLVLSEVSRATGRVLSATTTTMLPPPQPPAGLDVASWAQVEALNPIVRIGGGSFEMGSDGGQANEAPAHPVTLSPFYLQQREVTNAEYQRFYARHRFMPGTEDKPVLGLTWGEAREYAQWLGGDLPTEAQWEFAARGAAGRRYPWGEATPSCERANFLGCGAPADVRPVGGREAGATPEGILDLAGNAPEWVLDWFGGYDRGSKTDPRGPANGSQRVLRGGSFGLGEDPLRATARYAMQPDIPGNGNGFRVAWSEAQMSALRGSDGDDAESAIARVD